MIDIKLIALYDEELAFYMQKELDRQRNNIELIASENFVSEAVMAAVGSHLTNKYAEGYPAKRYYGGCEYVDGVESLAIERAKSVFKCNYANVQPHSGASANYAVYFALLNKGDTVLGMNLAHGGHLTHGSSVNFSGRDYNIIPYGVSCDDELIDYDNVLELALKHKPKIIIAGASAYSRIIDFKRFREIADKVGAYLFVDMAHIAGLVAAGLHPSPLPHAHVVTTTTHKTLRGTRGGMILTNDEEIAIKINKSIFPGIQGGPLMHVIAGKAVALKEAASEQFKAYQQQVIDNAKALCSEIQNGGVDIVSGGTDNHLMLVKLKKFDTNGKTIERLLDECKITVNKNTIPFDTESPFITSGIRLGTPSVTTRGMLEDDMRHIGSLIVDIIKNKEKSVNRVKGEVESLCQNFPLYNNS